LLGSERINPDSISQKVSSLKGGSPAFGKPSIKHASGLGLNEIDQGFFSVVPALASEVEVVGVD
jgi:hypothetical protein